jgi:hypothetical protein
LPVFDILFERFLNAEWGDNRPKAHSKIVKMVIEFISASNDLNISLNEEQLMKLLEMYNDFIELVPAYTRF